MKAFQAYGNAGKVIRDTAPDAAVAYFEQFPNSRKCNVIEGTVSDNFFTVRYGRASTGDWPKSYKDVTKKQAAELE